MSYSTDRAMLDALLGSDRLTAYEEEAFSDIRGQIERTMRPVTKAQRMWIENRYKALELDAAEPAKNLVSSGQVPRGREVETPELLRYENLPKAPPGRRPSR